VPVKPQRITDAELAVLKLLWEAESLTARQIRERLYPQGTDSDQATVQKLLQRLERKGFISRDRSSFAHTFRANVSRSDVVGEQLESLAKKLTDGSMIPFIMHAVQNAKLTARARREIRELLQRRG
jgi:predicted transcriptional regulator